MTVTNKYLRPIFPVIHDEVTPSVDVYAVLEAFKVTCPARQHAIKKLLCAGLRGKGDSMQDLNEASQAIDRAMQLERDRLDDQTATIILEAGGFKRDTLTGQVSVKPLEPAQYDRDLAAGCPNLNKPAKPVSTKRR